FSREQLIEDFHHGFVGQTGLGGFLIEISFPGLLGLLDRLRSCAIRFGLAAFHAIDDRAQGDLGVRLNRQGRWIIAAGSVSICMILAFSGMISCPKRIVVPSLKVAPRARIKSDS